ncbi:DUF488 domain-containing protein [Kocuria coralli]|uniref:DUF488 domain-containing protein n=1 Tax=Kocuria coralli TaxID=1461025 RepID=A0A5J5KWK0_9MICC|nr:DUF488 domain-containing protein [Kocuria coralli]KAA9394029.1 DUF488 domain-containing protein [Kocuria coralli]
MTEIAIKRVREETSPEDGQRILVDRLWPRGVSKQDADLDGHPKEVAPSNELRTWFGHDPGKWEEFTDRYRAELDDNPAAEEFVEQIRGSAKVTLLFGAKDEEHNHAIVLRKWLEERL